ncbi:hypothetical protein Slin14017_G053920 [Septoria linicola]|nr:hypothetical protein Slin14017_G053920 [Septoria linicola]
MKQLKDNSQAYVACDKLKALPNNSNPFPLHPGGYPIVQPGERFCRLLGFGGVHLCGRSCDNQHDVQYHMEREHNIKRKENPIYRKRGGRLKPDEIEQLKDFYIDLIKHEKYPGKPGSSLKRKRVDDLDDEAEVLIEEACVKKELEEARKVAIEAELRVKKLEERLEMIAQKEQELVED